MWIIRQTFHPAHNHQHQHQWGPIKMMMDDRIHSIKYETHVKIYLLHLRKKLQPVSISIDEINVKH